MGCIACPGSPIVGVDVVGGKEGLHESGVARRQASRKPVGGLPERVIREGEGGVC